MNITMVDQNGQEPVQEVREESKVVPVVLGGLVEQSVGQMFNLRPDEITKQSDQINTLIEYAKIMSEDHTSEGIKWAIRSLQNKVGTPPLGQAWVPYLSQYAYLKIEEHNLKKEVEKYERA